MRETIRNVAILREAGFAIALVDFGTDVRLRERRNTGTGRPYMRA